VKLLQTRKFCSDKNITTLKTQLKKLAEYQRSPEPNQVLPLPLLPLRPKDFSFSANLFVSSERKTILNDFFSFVNDPLPPGFTTGLRLTSIGGEGKSTLAYTIACIGLANNYLTLYAVFIY
jgi:hypothetical protein